MIHHFFFFVSLSILFVHENTGKLGYTSDIAPTTPTIVVNVSWNETVLKSKTITTLQVVANPMLGRESPIHDQAWESLSKLNASFVRLALWFPYPKMGVAQLTPPSGYYMCGHLNGDSNANNWTLTMKCPPNSGVINKIDFGYWQQGTEKGITNLFSSCPSCYKRQKYETKKKNKHGEKHTKTKAVIVVMFFIFFFDLFFLLIALQNETQK